MLRRKYDRWSVFKQRQHRCFICDKPRTKNTSGYLPGFGPIWKCADCQGEYKEIVQSLDAIWDKRHNETQD